MNNELIVTSLGPRMGNLILGCFRDSFFIWSQPVGTVRPARVGGGPSVQVFAAGDGGGSQKVCSLAHAPLQRALSAASSRATRPEQANCPALPGNAHIQVRMRDVALSSTR